MKGWKTVSVRRSLLLQVERVLVTQTAKEMGLTNPGEFVDLALRDMLGKIHVKRFNIVGTEGDSVHIIDNRVEPLGKIITVTFRDEDAWCESCDENVCVHIQYLWVVPEIRKAMKEHGLKPLLMSQSAWQQSADGDETDEDEADEDEADEDEDAAATGSQ